MEDNMTITNAQYVEYSGIVEGINCEINGTAMFVPNNAVGNIHYDEIMRQVAEGTLTIADAD